MLIGSLVFYGVGDLRMLPVLVGAVVVNYLFAGTMTLHKKGLLFFIVAIDALMLAEFKFLGHVVDSSLMPIGISFFTFKMIAFQADLYNGQIKEKPTFRDTAAYFCMFPQVVSGPIMRYSDYEKNELLQEELEGVEMLSLDDKEEKSPFIKTLERLEDGFSYFAVGLGMKVLIADHLAMLWKEVGTIGYESISTMLAWLGAYAYTMELFFDFWGYSLMAAGIGVMIGFPFIVNFDHPYGSFSISEFYRRWHATLGSWFRDYVYIPLGGSRKGTFRTILNLFVVWIITGIWHGTTANFILWGMILFLVIVIEKYLVFAKLPKFLGKVIGKINVLVIIPLTWVIFAISDFNLLITYFKRLFPFFGEGTSVNQGDFMKNVSIYWYLLAVGFILMIPAVYKFWDAHRKHPLSKIFLFILFWVSVYSLSNAAGNPFMYFSF
ncbi:MBOAT family O-acyltransferase [Butyrivibrio proteoclasticus]|uniref:MBOAT family O-acyltransferase n=1 Tax=Butyrivibrio proteoclasticus TaxID=43305 RepID=UPI000B2FAB17|nr:MBOAT family O-acyltransferase [Butyrivibrio proteoclasticus]